MLAVATAVSPDGDGAFVNEDPVILSSPLSRTLLAEQQALTPPAATKAVQPPEPVAPKPAAKPEAEEKVAPAKTEEATAPKPAPNPLPIKVNIIYSI